MPNISIDEEANSLLNYTRKCDKRDAITSSRNKEADLRQARTAGGTMVGMDDSDDDMEITGSRKNVKVAKDSALAKLKSTRKKRIVTSPTIQNNEPLEIQDSDSDTVSRTAGEPSRPRALVVDSPSPKKKRAPKKQTSISAKAAARLSRIKSNPYVLDDVDEDDVQPSPRRPRGRDKDEDEVMLDEPYDDSFINDDDDDRSSDIHPATSPKRRKQASTGNASEKGKAKPKNKTPVRRKKQVLAEESVPPALLPIFDDEEDQDFVPDSADERISAPHHPPTRSSRKGKQKQVDMDIDGQDENMAPIGGAYSDGPNDSGEQTETDTPGRANTSKPRPKNRRVAALADEHQANTTTGHREPDEYGYTDDEPVDLTEEDPIDGGIIDVDVYDDAPSQRFREFEADFGQVKPEPGTVNGGPVAGGQQGPADNRDQGGVDEFDDFMFDQGFMDNLDDLDYMDPGTADDAMNGDFGNMDVVGAANGVQGIQTYTRTTGGNSSNARYSSEEEDDSTDRFIPISALSEEDRDFFLNHWRRSATEAQGLTGSEKQLAESRQQQAQAAANPRGRGRGGRSGGGSWRGRGRGGWRGKR
ncbi:hypothetical protein QFC22_006053 [Naganishia vaughanmartiniae]|uniref:Uncharacterized protein n=1 Tax=Naganishia vaughanmartiniae TaxID=1424756 RepID=A0ACC2WN92_9TREE|nr:hypothetical protein QFC22_006053 [Naganishia vaughanmartiniae]